MTLIIPAGSIIGKLTTWWANPLFRKIVFYGALALFGLWSFKVWLNGREDKAYLEGQVKSALKMKDELDKEYKLRLEAAQAAAVQANKDKEMANARYDQVTGLFNQAFARLREIKLATEKREVIYVKESAAIPASKLDGALRVLSDDIAGKPVK